MRTYLLSAFISSVMAAMLHCNAISQRNVQVQYVKVLGASKQAYAGGAAGSSPGTIYLITCKVMLPAEISNVQAAIEAAPMLVKIVYKNAEYNKLYLSKGDIFSFRLAKRNGVYTRPGDNDKIPEPQPSSNSGKRGKETAIIRYTINKTKNEQFQVKKFIETAPRIYQ